MKCGKQSEVPSHMWVSLRALKAKLSGFCEQCSPDKSGEFYSLLSAAPVNFMQLSREAQAHRASPQNVIFFVFVASLSLSNFTLQSPAL